MLKQRVILKEHISRPSGAKFCSPSASLSVVALAIFLVCMADAFACPRYWVRVEMRLGLVLISLWLQ